MTPRHEGFSAEPNVTPMIDVLLVMLIVFLVAMMRVHRAIDTQLAQSCDASCASPEQIVLEVLPGPRYRINRTEVASSDLLAQLRTIYSPRPEKIIEIAGHRGTRYDHIFAAMDIAKTAGVAVITVAPKGSFPDP